MSHPNAIMDVVRDMFRKELKKHDDAKAAHKRAFLEHTLLTKRTALALGHTGNPRDGKSMKATEELASIVEPGGKKGEKKWVSARKRVNENIRIATLFKQYPGVCLLKAMTVSDLTRDAGPILKWAKENEDEVGALTAKEIIRRARATAGSKRKRQCQSSLETSARG